MTDAASTRNPYNIPADRQARFAEGAGLIEEFGKRHLDEELTTFALRLWARVCRRDAPDCLRGKLTVWIASVIHVIARMNFLFDKNQPVHLTFDTICNHFQANKTTVGSKATQIEKNLKLGLHNEPGLCRAEFIDSFTMIQLSNGMILTLGMAKKQGLLPKDWTP